MPDISMQSTFQVIDELGIDPLRNEAYDAVQSVVAYSLYTVKPQEEHNMILLSYNVYSNENYWWAIMMYNGIADMFAVKAGMRIKIPEFGSMVTALTNLLTAQPTQIATVTI